MNCQNEARHEQPARRYPMWRGAGVSRIRPACHTITAERVAVPLKYRNVKTVVDGITFDSKKEANRWCELKLLEKAGEISGLKLQPEFPITINGQKVCKYIADFEYVDSELDLSPVALRTVIEDVKSPATRKNSTYRLKKKLVEAVYGIEITEV